MEFVCKQCTECCKRYWIILLPDEAKAISENLEVTLEKFISENCVTFLQVFPANDAEKKNYYTKEEISKSIPELANEEPEFFAILPFLAIKRVHVEGRDKCTFLDGTNCLIYPVRPGQCQIFPRLGFKRKKVFFEFCEGLKQPYFLSEEDVQENKDHYEKVKDYFKLIAEKKFSEIWPVLPDDTTVLYQNKTIAKKDKKIIEELSLWFSFF